MFMLQKHVQVQALRTLWPGRWMRDDGKQMNWTIANSYGSFVIKFCAKGEDCRGSYRQLGSGNASYLNSKRFLFRSGESFQDCLYLWKLQPDTVEVNNCISLCPLSEAAQNSLIARSSFLERENLGTALAKIECYINSIMKISHQ